MHRGIPFILRRTKSVVAKDAAGGAFVYGALSEKTRTPDAPRHMANDATAAATPGHDAHAGHAGHEGHAAAPAAPAAPTKEYRIVATAISIAAP